ncbi:MAG: RNA polymerase sigma-70 factor [Adhaeribacter sp.]
MSSNDNLSIEPEDLSFQDLFNKYYSRLVYFSFQIVGSKEPAEDIAQEAFIKYWNQKEEIAPHQLAIKGFLYNTVRNISLNAVRHQKVKDTFAVLSSHASMEEEGIINAIIHAEVLAELHHAIATLPESCQRITRMGYLEGMKNQEIAEELGISVNTVKTQKQRALQLLRGRLNPELYLFMLFLEV